MSKRPKRGARSRPKKKSPTAARRPNKGPASPAPSSLPRVQLRARRRGHHPWVYRRMLRGPYAELAPGTLVEALAEDGRFAGRGFYNPNSEIALRLLTEERKVYPDKRWFRETIARAVAFRHEVLRLRETTDAYRVIHSEGDGLSGLVVDRFGAQLVVEVSSAGIRRRLDWIRAGLAPHFPGARIRVRASARSEKLEGVAMAERADPDSGPAPCVIREGRARFHVDLRGGHKTGFFLDQREHRARWAALCADEDLLDGCCYTGAFAIGAVLGGARRVEALDLDEEAVRLAEKNARLNKVEKKIRFVHGNVFNVLRAHHAAKRSFSRMVLDPPKLARTRRELPKALAAQADMNRLGMRCLQPGGILLSCSCSGLVSEEDFLQCLRAAAADARLELQVFHVGGAAADHPWALRMPEGRYLKAVFSRVRPLP